MTAALRPLGQRMRPSEEIVRAALCPGDASVFLDGLSRHHLQMVLAQAWVDGAAQGRAIERDRAMIAATQQATGGEGCAYCGPGVRTGLPGNGCEHCMGTGLRDPVQPTAAWQEEVSGGAEELAWIWLDLQQDCSPADIDYSADQMVDAFMAGRASKLLSGSLATQQAVSPPEGVGEAQEVLLLASYCDDGSPSCSDARPCGDCLAMSNVFRCTVQASGYQRELGPPAPDASQDHPHRNAADGGSSNEGGE